MLVAAAGEQPLIAQQATDAVARFGARGTPVLFGCGEEEGRVGDPQTRCSSARTRHSRSRGIAQGGRGANCPRRIVIAVAIALSTREASEVQVQKG